MAAAAASGEVTAAVIAAAVAAVVGVANLVGTVWIEQKRRNAERTLAAEQQNAERTLAAEQRDAELIVAALGYFQKSQRRSVGIAALDVLHNRRAWNEYRGAVSQLFYRQLLYLFAHGENRWQAHEISNIEGMTEWLLDGKMSITPEMKCRLSGVMGRYEEAWNEKQRQSKEEQRKGDPDPESVTYLINRIGDWRHSLDGRATAKRQ
jgi:hypothetical protein